MLLGPWAVFGFSDCLEVDAGHALSRGRGLMKRAGPTAGHRGGDRSHVLAATYELDFNNICCELGGVGPTYRPRYIERL